MIHRTQLARVAVILCLLGILCAGDWPQFRGPNGTGVAAEKGLPTEWSPTKNIRWQADLPGRGLSNPVIAGGKVFVTASSGYRQDRLHVLAFDAKTGKQLWERQIYASGKTACHPKTCMAAPTPVTDGERVFALFATADVVCYDSAGNLQWYRSLAGDYPGITNQVGMAASPILWKDVLVLPMENAGDSFVVGIDKLTGQNRWRTERLSDINWATPLLITNAEKSELLLQDKQEISAFDPATGKKLWSYSAKGLANIPSPSVARDLVLVPGGELVALKPATAQAGPEVLWQSNKLKSTYGTPLYYDGHVYNVNNAGVLNSVDAADGKALGTLRLKGPFSASIVACDGKLIIVNEEGTTFVVRAGPEPELLATNPLGEVILATPAIADGAIFLRSDKHLFCIAGK